MSHAGDALVLGVRLVARLGALLRGRRGLAPAARAAAAGEAAEAAGASDEAPGAAWDPTDAPRGADAAPAERSVLGEVVEVDHRVGRDHRVGLQVGLQRFALLAGAHLAAEVEPLGGRPLQAVGIRPRVAPLERDARHLAVHGEDHVAGVARAEGGLQVT
eukprot:1637118-Pyramimonas_sp.AAC.1